MCYHIYVMMHVKDPQPSVVRVGHCVPLVGLYLSLYNLCALNRDVNMTQTNKTKQTFTLLAGVISVAQWSGEDHAYYG